ncbi:hypothetical protein [Clostridium sp.]|uniref:hypothetical protein n=1 Tax=Clostridium sp. TaxID=1506 RepID=UPI002903980C|nr:hypothetical protein [Clostridium sp.]MDU1968862.1 hypothetical protein [Clostridium perfringens]MDU1822386.1 hypothetical protein [Clostridium sp.]MDU1841552.1 hypothetical protein [Clostridium sp.]MDU2689636.1 hypothetical protein [Clostridium sp.]MDU2955819.1 hypothetical protein [Clostridium sp.]
MFRKGKDKEKKEYIISKSNKKAGFLITMGLGEYIIYRYNKSNSRVEFLIEKNELTEVALRKYFECCEFGLECLLDYSKLIEAERVVREKIAEAKESEDYE